MGLGPIEAGLRFLPIGVGVLLFAIADPAAGCRSSAPRRLVLGGTAATAVGGTGPDPAARPTPVRRRCSCPAWSDWAPASARRSWPTRPRR